jgi:hypothetical protein
MCESLNHPCTVKLGLEVASWLRHSTMESSIRLVWDCFTPRRPAVLTTRHFDANLAIWQWASTFPSKANTRGAGFHGWRRKLSWINRYRENHPHMCLVGLRIVFSIFTPISLDYLSMSCICLKKTYYQSSGLYHRFCRTMAHETLIFFHESQTPYLMVGHNFF